jgi:hypothetical protein
VFGGGFVIIPLMQGNAVHTYHGMTNAQCLNARCARTDRARAVAATVAAVGYAARGLATGLLAALVAFTPSFTFFLIGRPSVRAAAQQPECPRVPRRRRPGRNRRDRERPLPAPDKSVRRELRRSAADEVHARRSSAATVSLRPRWKGTDCRLDSR